MRLLARGRTEGGAWLTNLALVLFGLLIVQFCRVGVNEFHHYTYGLSADIFGQIILFLGAISVTERCATNRWTLPIILSFALLARLVCVFHPAFLSTDVYRYVWDGEVQAAGINPFRYIPADLHLGFLRDLAIYPHINRRDYAHTIYPPGAQLLFLLITRISASEPFMKLAMVGFEAATCLVLMRTLPLLGQPRERVLLYAWNPLCFWEIASSGHADAAALTLLALMLYAALRKHTTAAGAWLGAAALVKLYPAALLPTLLRFPLRKAEWRTVTATLAVVAAGYACYSSVGKGVFGFLPAYAQEEGIESGSRYFPLTFVNRMLHTKLPPSVYLAFCAVALLAVCAWVLRRATHPEAVVFSSLVLATALNLCYAPHYPWYFLWLLPALTLCPWRPTFYLVTASTFLFSTQLGAPGAPMYRLNELLYGGFAAVLAFDVVSARIGMRVTDENTNHYQPGASALHEQLANVREL